jgi:Fic family protein
LLYISHYFKRHRQQYYDSLQRIRDHDDWEGWMRFFLKGVQAVALEATETARRIQSLREQYRDLVARRIRGTGIGFVLLDYLFEMPIVSVKMVAQQIGRSYPVANDLVATFTDLGLLRETTKQRRNRIYSFQPYVDLFEESNGLRSPS